MNKTTIIWDADNTLWDWVKYATHSYPKMAEEIAKITNTPLKTIQQTMQEYYTLSGTIENEYLIQYLTEKAIFKNPPTDINNLIQQAQQAFAKERKKHLEPYPYIEDSLIFSIKQGIKNIILTDAPSTQAKLRLKYSGITTPTLEQLTVFALKPETNQTLPEAYQLNFIKGKYKTPFNIHEIDTPKPHTDLEQVLQMTKQQIQESVIIIGDNYAKDIELAKKYGCSAIHAKYGTTTEEALLPIRPFIPTQILSRSFSKEQQPQTNQEPKNIKTAESPQDLIKIIQDLLT